MCSKECEAEERDKGYEWFSCTIWWTNQFPHCLPEHWLVLYDALLDQKWEAGMVKKAFDRIMEAHKRDDHWSYSFQYMDQHVSKAWCAWLVSGVLPKPRYHYAIPFEDITDMG